MKRTLCVFFSAVLLLTAATASIDAKGNGLTLAVTMLDYQPRSHRRTSARAGHRVRPERHNPQSIATLRIAIARQLLEQLPHCPFCGGKSAG